MNNSPPAPMVHISLFSGIGGFEIAAAQVGWLNAASCEINDFGHKVLQYHFPNSYHHRDVKTLTYKIINEELTKRFGPNWRAGGVILSGGFPCQGFSVAGNRLGTDDDRYLWPEYLRLIDEIQPDWVCGENVTGILTMEDKSGIYRDVFAKVENRKITRFHQIDYYEAIYTRQSKMLVNSICESLEERGYEVQPFAIPAASVEAPHIRERVWFIANSDGGTKNKIRENYEDNSGKTLVASRTNNYTSIPIRSSCTRTFADSGHHGLPSTEQEKFTGADRFTKRGTTEQLFASQNGSRGLFHNFPTQSPVCGGDDGIPAELDGITFSKWRNESIKGFGNAVVPEVVYEIFYAIEKYRIFTTS